MIFITGKTLPLMYVLYIQRRYRCQGISGQLLNIVVKDMKSKGISPLYLITDHIGFYERYGWEFFCAWFKGMMNPICQECIFTDSLSLYKNL